MPPISRPAEARFLLVGTTSIGRIPCWRLKQGAVNRSPGFTFPADVSQSLCGPSAAGLRFTGQSPSPLQFSTGLRDWHEELATTVEKLEEYTEIKRDLESRLQKIEERSKNLEQQLYDGPNFNPNPAQPGDGEKPGSGNGKGNDSSDAANNGLQQFFSLMYKIQILEVENMEVEETNQMTDIVGLVWRTPFTLTLLIRLLRSAFHNSASPIFNYCYHRSFSRRIWRSRSSGCRLS